LEYGVSRWREDDGRITQHRRTLPFELALFLAQKEGISESA